MEWKISYFVWSLSVFLLHLFCMALQKMDFSEIFIFASFRIDWFLKFGNCLIFEVWNFFEKNLLFLNSQKFCEKTSEISLGQKLLFFGQKPLFWVKKYCVWGKNRWFGVKDRDFWIFQTYKNFRICSIPNFP